MEGRVVPKPFILASESRSHTDTATLRKCHINHSSDEVLAGAQVNTAVHEAGTNQWMLAGRGAQFGILMLWRWCYYLCIKAQVAGQVKQTLILQHSVSTRMPPIDLPSQPPNPPAYP